MATATVKKTFPAKTGAPQIKWILQKHGQLTVWEIVDKLADKGIKSTFDNVQRSLMRLRDKEEAGVFNYKEELRRQRKAGRGAYWEGESARLRRLERVGKPTGGKAFVEIWGLVNGGD